MPTVSLWAGRGCQSKKMTFAYALFRAVGRSMTDVMMLDEEYVHGIMVRNPVDDVTTVEFEIVSYGDNNMVEIFKRLKETIEVCCINLDLLLEG